MRLTKRCFVGLLETSKQVLRKKIQGKEDSSVSAGYISLRRTHLKRKIHQTLSCVSTVDVRPFGAKGNVVIVHGYRSHLGSMKSVIEAFYDAGFNVFAFDWPNHGSSVANEKDHGFIESQYDLLKIVQASILNVTMSESRGDLPTFIVGHSAGATAVLRLLQKTPSMRKKIQGVIPVSLPIDLDHNVKPFVRNHPKIFMPIARGLEFFWPRAPMDHPLFAPGARDGFEDDPTMEKDDLFYDGPLMSKTAMELRRMTIKMRERFGELYHMPMLFIHGTADATKAPYSILKEEYDNVASKHWSWKACKGVGHDPFYEYEPTINIAVKWVSARVKRLEAKKYNQGS